MRRINGCSGLGHFESDYQNNFKTVKRGIFAGWGCMLMLWLAGLGLMLWLIIAGLMLCVSCVRERGLKNIVDDVWNGTNQVENVSTNNP